MTETELITKEKENEIERNKWRGRRKMAWVSLISMIVVTILVLFIVPKDRLTILGDVVTWFYFSMSSIIGFYVGSTTWATIKK